MDSRNGDAILLIANELYTGEGKKINELMMSKRCLDLQLKTATVGSDAKLRACLEIIHHQVAISLPCHLPQLNGSELYADRNTGAHRQWHKPGLPLLRQLSYHGAVQPRLPGERDAWLHGGPVPLVQRGEVAAAQLRAVEGRRDLAPVVVDADALVGVGGGHVDVERVGHRHRRGVHVEPGDGEPVHAEVGDLGPEDDVEDARRGGERDDEKDDGEQGAAHAPAAAAVPLAARGRGQRRGRARRRGRDRELQLLMAGFLAPAGLLRRRGRRRRRADRYRVDPVVVSHARSSDPNRLTPRW
ncbi:hypothetical protein PAHAL_7G337900 [Panicum hallii]|jgi:hypothetical protein|uniref:Uncharacterized protein n=1 Tax=Panicum hallii TaxID=206008 RepID=A0A2T8IEA7_9POAL|nr:hypothetical protein PAHAL_7G337900 [Panicum hallii]